MGAEGGQRGGLGKGAAHSPCGDLPGFSGCCCHWALGVGTSGWPGSPCNWSAVGTLWGVLSPTLTWAGTF